MNRVRAASVARALEGFLIPLFLPIRRGFSIAERPNPEQSYPNPV